MKEDYKLLYQAILYAAAGVFLGITIAILVLKYAIWLWNAFPEKTPPAIELTQQQTDDMCVKWWTETDITAAKKRVCGK